MMTATNKLSICKTFIIISCSFNVIKGIIWQITHKHSAEKHKADKVGDGKVEAALLRVLHQVLALEGGIGEHHVLVALLGLALGAAHARVHDRLPVLARGAPKEQQQGGREALKVGVPIDLRVHVELDVAEYLHADDGVDEE